MIWLIFVKDCRLNFNMNDIVEYGRELFARYDSREIDIKGLDRELQSVAHQLTSNDIAVLTCYCEQDKAVNLILQTIESYNSAKFTHDNWVEDSKTNPKATTGLAFMLMMTELEKSGIFYDGYFKCDDFTKMIPMTWISIWGDDWKTLIGSADAKLTALKFWQEPYDKYILPYV